MYRGGGHRGFIAEGKESLLPIRPPPPPPFPPGTLKAGILPNEPVHFILSTVIFKVLAGKPLKPPS